MTSLLFQITSGLRPNPEVLNTDTSGARPAITRENSGEVITKKNDYRFNGRSYVNRNFLFPYAHRLKCHLGISLASPRYSKDKSYIHIPPPIAPQAPKKLHRIPRICCRD